MLFRFCFAISVTISLVNAETVVKELQLSKSQDLTRVRVEYYKDDATPSPYSLTYSLWKGI